MPYAITLPLDAGSAGTVEGLWCALAKAGVSQDSLRLGYGPHITLAICPDDMGEETLRSALTVAAAHLALPVEFASLGVFPGPMSVLFLAPVATPALLAIHEAVASALDSNGLHPHYRPGRWVPHVTLAKDLRSLGSAMTALAPPPLPIPASLERADLLQFRPVRLIVSLALGEVPP